MRPEEKKDGIIFLFPVFLVLFFYLLKNTGVASDDFIYMWTLKDKSIRDILNPGLYPRLCPQTPLESVFFFMWYPFFSLDNLFVAHLLKIGYIVLSFFMIAKFFSIYLTRIDAILASFFFIFFPSHDATVYWFLGQYLTISMAFYLYSYYLAYDNRLISAFVTASAASFLSYGSFAIAISLFLIFILNRQFKKGLVIFIPNLIYSIYYMFIGRLAPGGINRIPDSIDIPAITRQFLFQALTAIDALIGPSMWLKIYYSFSQLSLISVSIGIILIVLIHKLYKGTNSRYDPKIIIGFTCMALASFFLFAITGAYPQLAFNLGNRVTIFGSLLVSYLIVAMPASRWFKVVIFSALFFSILGISDHWKAWNVYQREVMKKIENNHDLKNYKGEVIFVSGNQYSKFGKLSHIEFFSEDQLSCIFNMLLGKDILAKPLNKRHKYENGYLVDKKYSEKIKVADYINVYDSDKDKFFQIKAKDINKYISSLPDDNRHWTQLFDIKFIKDLSIKFMPRLQYTSQQ